MSVSISVLIGFMLGALLGGTVVYLFLRYRAGGRSVGAVRRELDDYKQEVGRHFDKTSELFASMTEQYRSLYEHLSDDAQLLTGKDSVAMALEATKGIVPGQKVEERIEDNRISAHPVETGSNASEPELVDVDVPVGEVLEPGPGDDAEEAQPGPLADAEDSTEYPEDGHDANTREDGPADKASAPSDKSSL
jgi:uncharacterized membrane-anchored protein YhcB (DUF1043 family)